MAGARVAQTLEYLNGLKSRTANHNRVALVMPAFIAPALRRRIGSTNQFTRLLFPALSRLQPDRLQQPRLEVGQDAELDPARGGGIFASLGILHRP
jgi:hypothetical protein